MSLTPEEEKRIQVGIARTWEAIASDWLALSETETVRKSEVLEAVLDADRLREYGETHGPGRPSPEARRDWQELVDRFYTLPRARMNKIARAFSPYERFGL